MNFIVYIKFKVKNVYLNNKYNSFKKNGNKFCLLFKFGEYIFIKNNILKFINKVNCN